MTDWFRARGERRPGERRLGLLVALGVIAAFAFAVAACGGGSEEEAAPAETPAASAEPQVELFAGATPEEGAEDVDTSSFKSDKDTYVIGFADISLVNSWRVQARKTAELVAEELGVDLRVTDANGDPTKQIADIEDLLAQGIDALVVTPVAPEPLAPVLERAADSGIPVIVWSTEAATDKYTARILADDRYFGAAGAEALCEALGGQGEVIMLRGIAGVSVETLRYEGAKETLEGCGITIAGEEYGDWAFEKGKAAAQTLLAAHPDVDGVWSSGAEMTKGAVQAFEEAGKELVPMSGEHQNGFLELWQEKGFESVAPVYPTWQGAEAIKLAVLALQGQPIKRSYLLTPPAITNDTLESVIKPDLSDDYWVEGYLTDEQVGQIFPPK